MSAVMGHKMAYKHVQMLMEASFAVAIVAIY